MSKNIVQEERMKGYFVQSAMEILRGEGIRDLSVRNVAEKAGYSYATLYNYFKDLNDLLTICIGEFQNENKINIIAATQYIPRGKQRLAMIYYTYIKYYIQYPGTFDLVYINKFNSQDSRNLIINFLDELCKEDWNYLIENNIYNKETVAHKKDSVKYMISGMLLLYNNLQYPEDFNKFQYSVKQQFSDLLDL